MADRARVHSIDVLEKFRPALVKFVDECSAAIVSAEADAGRAVMRIRGERLPYWKKQIRVRQDEFTRAKSELAMKQVMKDGDDARADADQRKLVEKARRRVTEAEDKYAKCRSWARRLEKEQSTFSAQVGALKRVLETEMPRAIAELEWVLERGARVILVRPAPVHGLQGPRSFALPEFDPFWSRVEEAGVLVGMHASDSGYQRYTNEWEGIRGGEFKPFVGPSGFAAITGGASRAIMDSVASAIGHGMLTRFPRIRMALVENGSGWVRPLMSSIRHAYALNPRAFDEDPVEVFKRCIFVHPFHEDDPRGLADLIGIDNVIFGSDYPHPEGLADPISFVDELDEFDDEEKAKIMGGNLARLMSVDDRVSA